jgi:hypothetical protein
VRREERQSAKRRLLVALFFKKRSSYIWTTPIKWGKGSRKHPLVRGQRRRAGTT